MLQHIHIKNFTIIDDLELDLTNGMTVLTGETGSGKSIVIDAIEIALGKRVNTSLVKAGQKRADISLLFDLTNIPDAKSLLSQYDLNDDDECLIRRTLTNEGRSKSFINDTPVTLNLLRELAETLLNIHGQHEFQTLIKPDKQIRLLDQFAKHEALVKQVNETYKQWHQKQTDYQNLLTNSEQAKSKAEYLAFQLEELNNFAPKENEIAELEQEHKTLSHTETLLNEYQTALNLLSEDDSSILSQLAHCNQLITDAQTINPQLSSTLELLNNATIQCEEAADELQQQLNNAELNPERLDTIDKRLSKAYELARKHRVEPNQLAELQQQMLADYDQLEHHDEHLNKLAEEVKQLAATYQQQAKQLTKSRQQAVSKLNKLVTTNMQQLGMPGGKFTIELVSKDTGTLHNNGMEKANFLVTANPGQPPQPLNKVASGGELSRISLAIQVITTQQNNTPTLIFDEVDVGIGGATAETVGNLLRQLANEAQVLCITHLAQVAAKGHQHLQVSKTVKNKQTSSCLTLLNNEARIKEIARMSAGVKITEQALAHAKELLTL